VHLPIKILDDRLLEKEKYFPHYAKHGDHGIDLRACIEKPVTLRPGDACKIGVGWAVDMAGGLQFPCLGGYGTERGWSNGGFAIPKSGLGDLGLVVGNLVGLIDAGYHGQIKVTAWHRGGYVVNADGTPGYELPPITIHPMERFSQLVFMPVVHPELIATNDFGHVTDRGEGGHGSTGTD